MSFDVVFNYILKRTGAGVGAGLEGFRALLARLENPQEHYKIVHVAGTNGKGSASTLMAATLTAAGYKTGLFVSPHLVSPVERIQIDGENISRQAFSKAVLDVFQEEEEELNFFEILTAAALLYFARQKVQYVVLETGLGGRKDPTNVCAPVACLITSIGLDHTQYLGSSLAQIAFEKAGIIKPNVPVFAGEMALSAREVLRKTAKERNAPLYFVKEGEPFSVSSYDFYHNQTLLHTPDNQVWPLHTLGARQAVNACLVSQAAKTLNLPDKALKKAFQTVNLPGRFEVISTEKNTWVLDGAHNPQAIEGLMKFWQQAPFGENSALLCGFMKDKDYKKMLSLLCPHFKHIFITVPPSARGATEADIRAALPKGVKVTFEPDWQQAMRLVKGFGCVLCTGSFYLAGAVRGRIAK